jgi:TM2 domain-containing membrane protein YozV
MSAACPYCRAPIEQNEAQTVLCPGCGTPHHADCFEENGGCTIFGCSAAPAAEPKLSIAAPDLNAAGIVGAVPQVAQNTIAPPPPPPLIESAAAAPPPTLQATPQATSTHEGPPMFNSWGYSLLAHPLPDQEIERPPLFSSLGYGRQQPTPYSAPTRVTGTDGFAPDPSLPAKNRTVFLLLGVLLGAFGAHSFYAGSMKKGFLQLGITVLTFGFAGLMVWIWAVIDICTINKDINGIPFRN